ncbi:LPXTG cell wall anchor domain-containing protein [Kitasatospora sp. NPDC018619]|uniref:LPXTG cell wall anchor domain-containing protein n=1 Tax=unclassified Kitasatospora TaxID=2633591 RepID=UPI0037985351
MRLSVINRFAKNDRVGSGRRRLATLAATAVLVGGVQLLATDTAWACGAPDDAPVTAPAKPSAADEQDRSVELHGQGATSAFLKAPAAITAGGPAVEFSVRFSNRTGADYHRIFPGISVFNTKGATPKPSQVTAEVMSNGSWKRVTLRNGCDPAVGGTVPSLGAPLADGRSVDYRFRLALSADVAKGIDGLQVTVAPNEGRGASTEVAVVHPAAPAKPTVPAKPKPTPTKEAKEAEPAAEKAAGTGKAEGTAPTAAPATTAPAGTPELAQTGSSGTNTFLALGSGLFLALGAGVLVAVRRLRPQR